MDHFEQNCPRAVAESRQGLVHPSRAPSKSVPASRVPSSSARRSGVERGSRRCQGGRGQPSSGQGTARVYASTKQNVQASNTILTDFLLIFSLDAHVLFDPSSTDSYLLVEMGYHSCGGVNKRN